MAEPLAAPKTPATPAAIRAWILCHKRIVLWKVTCAVRGLVVADCWLCEVNPEAVLTVPVAVGPASVSEDRATGCFVIWIAAKQRAVQSECSALVQPSAEHAGGMSLPAPGGDDVVTDVSALFVGQFAVEFVLDHERAQVVLTRDVPEQGAGHSPPLLDSAAYVDEVIKVLAGRSEPFRVRPAQQAVGLFAHEVGSADGSGRRDQTWGFGQRDHAPMLVAACPPRIPIVGARGQGSEHPAASSGADCRTVSDAPAGRLRADSSLCHRGSVTGHSLATFRSSSVSPRSHGVDMPEQHEELAVFLGDWHAEGTSYGGDEQSSNHPHAGATPWNSIHSARWHSGEYFVVQDERANGPFDTLSVMGWDTEAGRYFARSIENHGFARATP